MTPPPVYHRPKLLVLLLAFLPSGSCANDDNICLAAIERYNTCLSDSSNAEGDPLVYIGPCTDVATLGGVEHSVLLYSWSKAYLGCEPEPEPPSCQCPDLPPVSEYDPPDVVSSATP